MRNMSFFYTQKQYLDGSKKETTRKGWGFLKSGDKFMGVQKGMGLKKGETINKLGPSVVLRNDKILINTDYYTQENVDAEGFPHLTPDEFVNSILIEKCRFKIDEIANRITFKRI